MNGFLRLTGESNFAERPALCCAAFFLGLSVNIASAEDASGLGGSTQKNEALENMVQSVGIDASLLGAGFENKSKNTLSEMRSNTKKLDEFVKTVGLDVSKLADELVGVSANGGYGHLPQFVFCSIHQRYESIQSFGRIPSQTNLRFDPLGLE